MKFHEVPMMFHIVPLLFYEVPMILGKTPSLMGNSSGGGDVLVGDEHDQHENIWGFSSSDVGGERVGIVARSSWGSLLFDARQCAGLNLHF